MIYKTECQHNNWQKIMFRYKILFCVFLFENKTGENWLDHKARLFISIPLYIELLVLSCVARIYLYNKGDCVCVCSL